MRPSPARASGPRRINLAELEGYSRWRRHPDRRQQPHRLYGGAGGRRTPRATAPTSPSGSRFPSSTSTPKIRRLWSASPRLALEYRYTFHTDVVVDLIGYRRHGHSEVDDPTDHPAAALCKHQGPSAALPAVRQQDRRRRTAPGKSCRAIQPKLRTQKATAHEEDAAAAPAAGVLDELPGRPFQAGIRRRDRADARTRSTRISRL